MLPNEEGASIDRVRGRRHSVVVGDRDFGMAGRPKAHAGAGDIVQE